MYLRPSLLAVGLALTAGAPALAETYYAAPRDAKPCAAQTGTEACPFATPGAALAKAKAGDTILLMDGNYDGWTISGKAPDTPITIQSQNDKKARLGRVVVKGGKNLVFKNLSIWPDASDTSRANRIDVQGASDMVFDGIDARSAEDAINYPNWNKSDWAEASMTAVWTRGGSHTTIQNSTFLGFGFVIQFYQENGDVLQNNQIRGFSGDGIRIVGNDAIIRGNLITDNVNIDENHADAIQSWSTSGPVKNLLIEGNAIIQWSNPIKNPITDTQQYLQGIGFFDGFYDDLVIRNNLVSVTAYHGISVYGGRGVEIVNNTVVNNKGEHVTYPWLGVFSHKNGTPAQDVTVANNLAMSFKAGPDAAHGVIVDTNAVITYPAKVFSDITKYDYIPKPDSGFIDAANKSYAPSSDLRGVKRPVGKGPDLGAYEVSAGGDSAPPPDTPVTESPTEPPKQQAGTFVRSVTAKVVKVLRTTK